VQGMRRAQAWNSDGGTGAIMLAEPGGPKEESVSGHQGAPTQLLRMHSVFRVVRSGCGGVSFERRDSVGQETVAVGGKGNEVT
jgi:hypothetical protein